MRGQKWVRTLADLYLDPAKQAASGAGQAWSADSVVMNYDGYLVRKSQRGSNGERPIALVTCTATDAAGACTTTTNIHDMGIAAPDFRMGMNTTFAYKRFSATGLLRLEPGWPDLQRHRALGQSGLRLGALRPVRQAGRRADRRRVLSGRSLQRCFGQRGLRRGRHLPKLRELSVNYTSTRTTNKVGLPVAASPGRRRPESLHLTPYRSRSEVAPLTELNGGCGVPHPMDWFQYPQFRTHGEHEIAF
jgi:hypothetical protein